jgi:hypothetical protein
MNLTSATPNPAVRPKTDRFLIGIFVGLAVLLVVVGVSVAVLRQPASDLPADTPSGVLQRFYRAIEQQDYGKAYDYLADGMTHKPTRDRFVSYNLKSSDSNRQERVHIDSEKVYSDSATVKVSITHYYASGGPFGFGGSGEFTTTDAFSLKREHGAWRITELPHYQTYEFIPPENNP